MLQLSVLTKYRVIRDVGAALTHDQDKSSEHSAALLQLLLWYTTAEHCSWGHDSGVTVIVNGGERININNLYWIISNTKHICSSNIFCFSTTWPPTLTRMLSRKLTLKSWLTTTELNGKIWTFIDLFEGKCLYYSCDQGHLHLQRQQAGSDSQGSPVSRV